MMLLPKKAYKNCLYEHGQVRFDSGGGGRSGIRTPKSTKSPGGGRDLPIIFPVSLGVDRPQSPNECTALDSDFKNLSAPIFQ